MIVNKNKLHGGFQHLRLINSDVIERFKEGGTKKTSTNRNELLFVNVYSLGMKTFVFIYFNINMVLCYIP